MDEIKTTLSTDITPVVVNLMTLTIVIAAMIGVLIVVFRAASRGKMIEGAGIIFTAAFVSIYMVRWYPGELIGSLLIGFQDSRQEAYMLNQELNTWLWESPENINGFTPGPGDIVEAPPLFGSPTPSPIVITEVSPTPTSAPTIVNLVATETPLPTETSTPMPPTATATSWLDTMPPTPAIVTRMP